MTACEMILRKVRGARIVVLGDLMLDHFVWGGVHRISPEAPVPVVEFLHESFMPGGAANVAANISALGASASILGILGTDLPGRQLMSVLRASLINVKGLTVSKRRPTAVKMRIISGQQQIVRLDREVDAPLSRTDSKTLRRDVRAAIAGADAVVIGDYCKGVLTQQLLDLVKRVCRRNGVWLSVDPKPSHNLDLRGLSLITPNRREAFQLAGMLDTGRNKDPLCDRQLMDVAKRLMESLRPEVLLITLGEMGMLVCIDGTAPVHIPTVARQVYDVSGAGDTAIASFTIAVAAGASALEAAEFANHAAGIAVGKLGTAVVTPRELKRSIRGKRASL